MSAYYLVSVEDFLVATPRDVTEHILFKQPGSTPQQMRAWIEQVEVLQPALQLIRKNYGLDSSWCLLFEYELIRLKKRIDLVLLANDLIFCIEFKCNADSYAAVDRRQAEDYAFDLRDFHLASRLKTIVPILCATEAPALAVVVEKNDQVCELICANRNSLSEAIWAGWSVLSKPESPQIDPVAWNQGSYKPVPSIIDAAEKIYGDHTVMDINEYLTDQESLVETTERMVELVREAERLGKHYLLLVTGVPGSGKTLTGLKAVHDARIRSDETKSSAYLSGNSPLVAVLREALAKDQVSREGINVGEARKKTRAAIQHLMDFLKNYLDEDKVNAPHEHMIVFDEAQRAWDAKFGMQKFGREASEPELVLGVMARHQDWAVVVALVGGGQEINSGEGGLELWGEALEKMNRQPSGPDWKVFAPPQSIDGSVVTAGSKLFANDTLQTVSVSQEPNLHLPVSIRSHRSELTNEWIDAVLVGNRFEARARALGLDGLKIYMTRSLEDMQDWLTVYTKGHRRCGLVASSGARRLRAYGVTDGVGATDLNATVQWFLQPRGDVRSSYSLEVPANEYGCQGLELDNVGLCWGGDLTWSDSGDWRYKRFSGTNWQNVNAPERRENITNKYRVLLSRARDSLVIWVPPGDERDKTRSKKYMDATAKYLVQCGVKELPELSANQLSNPFLP